MHSTKFSAVSPSVDPPEFEHRILVLPSVCTIGNPQFWKPERIHTLLTALDMVIGNSDSGETIDDESSRQKVLEITNQNLHYMNSHLQSSSGPVNRTQWVTGEISSKDSQDWWSLIELYNPLKCGVKTICFKPSNAEGEGHPFWGLNEYLEKSGMGVKFNLRRVPTNPDFSRFREILNVMNERDAGQVSGTRLEEVLNGHWESDEDSSSSKSAPTNSGEEEDDDGEKGSRDIGETGTET